MNFNRILCPVVLSPASGEPLRYAAALASAYSARLFICHWTEERSNTPTDGEVVRENIKRLLEDSVNLETGPAENGQLDWEPLVAEGRDPGEAIAAEAAKLEVDLIVMSSRRRPLRAAILGSTAEHVCHTAPCSVLITHPDTLGEAPDLRSNVDHVLRRSPCPILVARRPSLRCAGDFDSRGSAPD